MLTSKITRVFQFAGSAIGIATAQNIFNNHLTQYLPIYAPSVDVAQVLAVGATKLHGAFDAAELQGILQSYAFALQHPWTMSLALAGMAFMTSLLSKWKSIKAEAGNSIHSDIVSAV